MAEEIANKKAEKNTEFRFQLFNSILGAVVGSMATLFIEHFSEIIHFINSTLQSRRYRAGYDNADPVQLVCGLNYRTYVSCNQQSN